MSQSRKAIHRYTNYLKLVKFTRGMTVYQENEEALFIYIVYKGEFEQSKKLPRGDRIFDTHNLLSTGARPTRLRDTNILAKRLPEIKDLPYQMKLSIFGTGSLIGEEDIFSRTTYSTSLKCYSSKGVLLRLPKEQF